MSTSFRSLLCGLVLLLAGCGPSSADLEIDLRRADGGVWFDASARRTVDMCMVLLGDGGPVDGDGGAVGNDCVNRGGKNKGVFTDDEHDTVGVFLSKDVGLRIYWTAAFPPQCWVLELVAPVRGHLDVRLPVGNGQLHVVGCSSPACTIIPCPGFQ